MCCPAGARHVPRGPTEGRGQEYTVDMSCLVTRVWALAAASVFLLIGLAVVGSQPLCSDDGLMVLLPETPGSSIVGDRRAVVRLTLKANGTVFVQHVWCADPGKVRSALVRERSAHPRWPLVLVADRRLSYESVRSALGLARDAGFETLFLGGVAELPSVFWPS